MKKFKYKLLTVNNYETKACPQTHLYKRLGRNVQKRNLCVLNNGRFNFHFKKFSEAIIILL